MFKRVLIANRGEIVSRIIKSCKSMGIETVVIYSDADKNAAYLNEANEAIFIGESHSSKSYLNEDLILEVAERTKSQALHPGFGFLSENARFAERCTQQKTSFIGPNSNSIRLMGNKSKARETVSKLGLKIIPGSGGDIASLDDALLNASNIGYPVLLKAVSGGGGKGIRMINNSREMKDGFFLAKSEAQKSFSDARVYMEKYFLNARHIEFQILADKYGNVIHLGERECSIQRGHQKILEESPAFGFSRERRDELGDKICSVMRDIEYENAGTVEFLLDSSGEMYFMEMNTRIQVEHPVTELLTGLDIVSWQLKISAGERININQKDVSFFGHAIECRINAENVNLNFAPSPGLIEDFEVPKDNEFGKVRVDTHIIGKYKISSFYDSMLGKVIVHSKDRQTALRCLEVALDDFKINGVLTTLDFHKKIVKNSDFFIGKYSCSFLENFMRQINGKSSA